MGETLERTAEVLTPQNLVSDSYKAVRNNFSNWGDFGNGPTDPGGYLPVNNPWD